MASAGLSAGCSQCPARRGTPSTCVPQAAAFPCPCRPPHPSSCTHAARSRGQGGGAAEPAAGAHRDEPGPAAGAAAAGGPQVGGHLSWHVPHNSALALASHQRPLDSRLSVSSVLRLPGEPGQACCRSSLFEDVPGPPPGACGALPGARRPHSSVLHAACKGRQTTMCGRTHARPQEGGPLQPSRPNPPPPASPPSPLAGCSCPPTAAPTCCTASRRSTLRGTRPACRRCGAASCTSRGAGSPHPSLSTPCQLLQGRRHASGKRNQGAMHPVARLPRL